jgi:shikimate dehydrogenase
VVGHPITHTLSPRIHKQFAEQTDQNLIYQAIESPLDKFSETVEQFRSAGGRGLNITVPFKQQAWELCDQRSEVAERAGAVNTLLFDDNGQIRGDNTDGRGLVRDILFNHEQAIAGKRLLVLGAGGAVRGVLEPLLKEKPDFCVIANRTLSRAEELVDLFSDIGDLTAVEYSDLTGSSFDMIINGTSASLQGELPPLPQNILTEKAVCYDMMYAKTPTAFVKWGLDNGAELSVDGLGMLVEQAAESFYIWRGIRPETKSVISLLRT